MTPLTVLKDKFGYDTFRPGQQAIIDQVMAHENVLAIMPTGGGKSLGYQIPACLFDGLTVVVSPLISLMKDQVDALNETGIAATYINSTLSGEAVANRLAAVEQRQVQLLYVAPERFEDQTFRQWLRSQPVRMLAVDEAHCISQWGHDFRPSYLNLSQVIQDLPSDPVIIGLTATATPQVETDICQRLAIPTKNVVKTGFGRNNLTFQVVTGRDRDRYLKAYISARPDEAGIIYASTRKEVDGITNMLKKAHLSVTSYHGGMDDAERRQHQDEFLYDRATVMVATNAFGMGIDKSNVRYVIHAQLPGSLEAYYQEAGRAGRDGLDAEAVLLYRPQDVGVQRFFIDQSTLSDDLKHQEYQKLQKMVDYANTDTCYQQFIQAYFGETADVCGHCGNCLDDRDRQDITRDAQMILSCVKRMDQRFGKGLVAQVLTGAKNQRIRQFHFDQLSTYNLMGDRTQRSVGELIEYLTASGFLQPTGGQYPTLRLTDRGVAVILGQLMVTKKVERQVDRRQVEDGALFTKLRALRRALAETAGVPPFVIFSDKTLVAMCAEVPTSEAQLLDVKGVGQNKLEKYGAPFLDVIRQYQAENHATV